MSNLRTFQAELYKTFANSFFLLHCMACSLGVFLCNCTSLSNMKMIKFSGLKGINVMGKQFNVALNQPSCSILF